MIQWIKKEYGLVFVVVAIIGYYALYKPIKEKLILSPVLSLGVSTDGRYVISAHASRYTFEFSDTYVVLWDTKTKSKKILAEGINPFSAHFIPDSHEFMWQDKNDIMHIQNIDGEDIQTFEHVPVSSHVMSADKKTYISTTERRWIYSGYDKNMKLVHNESSGSIKPLYLSMVANYVLSSGNSVSSHGDPVSETNIQESPIVHNERYHSKFIDVFLWDKTTLKPIAKLNGNTGKVFALLSPNGKWAISGCEGGHNYMWSMDNLNKRLRLAEPSYGIFFPEKNGIPHHKDDSQLLDPSPKLDRRVLSAQTVAYAFLTETDFVQLGHIFEEGIKDRLAPLYTVGDPWIKGYVDLQADPMPSLDSYIRGLSVSSSYKAHVLVTGQATKGGINVYKYHPDTKKLDRTWVGGEFKYW